MTNEEQLEQWVNGNPVHDDERDICCPDFSCCTGVLAPLDVRERFAKAYHEKDDKTMDQMLMMFLGAALQGKNAYIAGDEVPDKLN
jgi:hypothetical protein